MQKKIIVLLFLFNALLITINAQFSSSYDFKCKTYTTADGLVHNSVKKCLNDKQGFLWVTTQNGLSRFDGVNFKNFQNKIGDENSLPYNDINDITIDNTNRLWLAYANGMCLYDIANRKFTKINLPDSDNNIGTVVYDSLNNRVWFCSTKGLRFINLKTLAVYSTSLKKSVTVQSPPSYPSFLDTRQRLWIPYPRQGYVMYDTRKDTFHLYENNTWPVNVYEDADSTVWIATWGDGLRKFKKYSTDPVSICVSKKEPDQIFYGLNQSIPLTGKKILWIVTNPEGILLFDKEQNKTVEWIRYDANKKNGLPTDFFNEIYCDKEGIIWLCSWRGLVKINKQEQQFQSAEIPFLKSDFYNLLTGIKDDPYEKNIAWVCANGSGLIRYNKVSKKITNKYFSSPGSVAGKDINANSRWVENMYVDAEKRIWCLTYNGIIEINKSKVTLHPLLFQNIISFPQRLLFVKNNIWIASRRGVIKFNADDYTYQIFRNEKDSLDKSAYKEENSFLDIAVIDSNTFLCGSRKGLFFFYPAKGVFKRVAFTTKNMATENFNICNSLEIINNDAYVATEAGLLQFNVGTQACRLIGEEQEIFKLNQNSLIKDNYNNLWIYTLHGLFRYDPVKNDFKKFTVADGLYDNSADFVALFSYQKNIFIGYRMAYTKFDPLKIETISTPVKPLIAEVQISNYSQPVFPENYATEILPLSYEQNNINFKFTGLNFTNSERISFEYMLDGFDKTWIQSGTNRTANYTNLSPGEYSFKVKANYNSASANGQTAVFLFTISNPFYATWWFIILCVAIGCLIIYFIYINRVRQLLALQKVRQKISTDLHDDIGSTLSSITMMSAVAKRKIKTMPDEAVQLTERMEETSRQMITTMSDIVWSIKPGNDTLDQLVNRLREYMHNIMENTMGDYTIKTDKEILQTSIKMDLRKDIYMMGKEIINNASKYSGAQHFVLKFEKRKNELILTSDDDGIGFDMEKIKKGNGLNNIYQRTKNHNGICTCKSSIGNGTKWRIEIRLLP